MAKDAQGFPLSEDELKDIASSWGSIEDKKKFGEQVFIQIFMYRPNIKRIFGLQSIPVDQLASAPRFNNHAGNFSNYIGKIVTAAKGKGAEQMAVIQEMELVGSAHFELTKGIKFDTAYWQLFVDAICDQVSHLSNTPKSKKNEKTIASYRKLFSFVVLKMRQSYLRTLETTKEPSP